MRTAAIQDTTVALVGHKVLLAEEVEETEEQQTKDTQEVNRAVETFNMAVVEEEVQVGILALVAMFLGSLVAIRQHNFKTMLAWSSIAQVGYIVLGISLVTQAGVAAAITHLFNHAIIKAGLFLVAGCLVFYIGASTLKDCRGLGKRMPWTSAAFVICGVSLIGVPLTAGFTSKWVLVSAALSAKLATFKLG